MITPHNQNRHVAVKTLYIKKLGLMVICSFLSLLFSLIYLTMLSIAQSYIYIVTATPSLKTYTNYDNKISVV